MIVGPGTPPPIIVPGLKLQDDDDFHPVASSDAHNEEKHAVKRSKIAISDYSTLSKYFQNDLNLGKGLEERRKYPSLAKVHHVTVIQI